MFGDPVKNERGWRLLKIKDAATVITGSTPPSSKENMFGGLIPFFTPGDLETNAPVQRYLTNEGSLHSRLVPPAATLVCCIGATIGKVGITQVTSAFNQQINAIVWNTVEINPTFGTFMMGYFKNFFRNNYASATTLPIINKSSFQSLEIIVPGLDIQVQFAAKFKALRNVRDFTSSSLVKTNHIFDSAIQRFYS
jgi:type I restriction enzyme S subunit